MRNHCTISVLCESVHLSFHFLLQLGLKPAEVVELCQGALNAGPAMCFVESRNLGTNAERSHLCNGANSAVRVNTQPVFFCCLFLLFIFEK